MVACVCFAGWKHNRAMYDFDKQLPKLLFRVFFEIHVSTHGYFYPSRWVAEAGFYLETKPKELSIFLETSIMFSNSRFMSRWISSAVFFRLLSRSLNFPSWKITSPLFIILLRWWIMVPLVRFSLSASSSLVNPLFCTADSRRALKMWCAVFCLSLDSRKPKVRQNHSRSALYSAVEGFLMAKRTYSAKASSYEDM